MNTETRLQEIGDRLEQAFGADLQGEARVAPAGASHARRGSWLATRRTPWLAAATASAATVATVLVTAGGATGPIAAGPIAVGPSSASAAIIRHVRAELTAPSGMILHESATVTLPDGSSMPFELWVQTGGTGVYRVIKFGQEVSLSATENEIYDASTNTVTVSPLPPASHQYFVSKSGDLAAQLRRMVDSGQATATPTTYNGMPAYKIILSSSGDPLGNGTAYVARSDYRPLEIDYTSNGGEKVVFSTYEYLRATPANDALLAVTSAHPGAKLVNQP